MSAGLLETQSAEAPLPTSRPAGDWCDLTDQLRTWFGCGFTLIDAADGSLLNEPPRPDYFTSSVDLARTVAGRGCAECVLDDWPLLILAIPVHSNDGREVVAFAPFVSEQGLSEQKATEAARLLGCQPAAAVTWINSQERWSATNLLRTAAVVMAKLDADRQVHELAIAVDELTDNLASTYEEISLLYRLTQNLSISSNNIQLGELALDWLKEVVPAEGFAIQYLPVDGADSAVADGRPNTMLISSGEWPLNDETFSELTRTLSAQHNSATVVANERITGQPTWQFAEVRQLVLVPLSEGDNTFGWLAAVNHVDGGEFGTIESSLLGSVAAILGIHGGNIELYRQQADFLANVVRALTSAIDAKDPYTCGHSDRVARVSVRLAEELGWDSDTLNRVYLSGLLHDIGKIGIDDNVLRKPGRLTDVEYKHIKLHPELGYKILSGMRQLDDVLPVVLHHHEQWDGKGYPHGLANDNIPLRARVCAVADAYDAMSSDRPYRKGMPDDKLDAILREGRGTQWDPAVIDAFFAARDDIRAISQRGRANLILNVEQWT